MTGRSHVLFTATLLWAAGRSWPEVVVAATTTLWPDLIERVTGGRHRGLSHWPGLWLPWWFAAAWVPWPAVGFLLRWMAVGALSHILTDMLSPRGVPLWIPTRPTRGLGLFRVGSWGEWLFLGLWVGLCLIGAWAGWFPLRWHR